jgi:hypothetical protein
VDSKTPLKLSDTPLTFIQLQELIASAQIIFYDCDWQPIGIKARSPDFNPYSSDWPSSHQALPDLSRLLSEITKIDTSLLRSGDPARLRHYLNNYSVAQKMSWAAGRDTTREEDRAYSLLGIFNISMPLLYGEGPKAFSRLQEEILKETDDHSIFAWGPFERLGSNSNVSEKFRRKYSKLLADSPEDFRDSGDVVLFAPWQTQTPITITSNNIRLETFIYDPEGSSYAILKCRPRKDRFSALAIPILEASGSQYSRRVSYVRIISLGAFVGQERQVILISKSGDLFLDQEHRRWNVVLDASSLSSSYFISSCNYLREVFMHFDMPDSQWPVKRHIHPEGYVIVARGIGTNFDSISSIGVFFHPRGDQACAFGTAIAFQGLKGDKDVKVTPVCRLFKDGNLDDNEAISLFLYDLLKLAEKEIDIKIATGAAIIPYTDTQVLIVEESKTQLFEQAIRCLKIEVISPHKEPERYQQAKVKIETRSEIGSVFAKMMVAEISAAEPYMRQAEERDLESDVDSDNSLQVHLDL